MLGTLSLTDVSKALTSVKSVPSVLKTSLIDSKTLCMLSTLALISPPVDKYVL